MSFDAAVAVGLKKATGSLKGTQTLKIFFFFFVDHFLFWLFGQEAWGILVPWPGIEPLLPALKLKVSITAPSGKSLAAHF